jgi:hypothetical protein
MVVVDQRDLAVPDVDMTRHLNEGCLCGRHNAQRITDRAAVTRHHPEKKVGGAGLIALQDRLRQHVKRLVSANLVSIEQHRGDLVFAGRRPQTSQATAPASRS